MSLVILKFRLWLAYVYIKTMTAFMVTTRIRPDSEFIKSQANKIAGVEIL